MNIVFMGTPDFAVPSLKALVNGGYSLTGVFSQPDKPKGRGHTVQPTPVKEAALALQIPVFQPAAMRNGGTLELLKSLSPDLIIVAAYGKILPREILEMPRLGCVNVHASLLPAYRGAAPIQWAVLNGEKVTGVTIMQMGEGIDTGGMLYTQRTAIGPDETSAGLFDRLAELGAQALLKAMPGIASGTLKPVPQDETKATFAPMITKAMCPMDFHRPAAELHNQVRGLQTWPVAVTRLHGNPLKVHSSRVAEGRGTPGEVLESGARLVVACGGNTALELLEIQLEGKKRMPAGAFLMGRAVPVGTLLGKE